MKKLAGGIIAAVFLVACGGGGDVEAFVKLDTSKGEAFAVGGEDCVAKAKSVREWRTKHNAEYKEMQGKLKGKSPKDLSEKDQAQLKTNKKNVMDAMLKCTNTPEFDAAIDDTKLKGE